MKATRSKRALIVSIHDVAPATQKACAQILEELVSRGVTRCSLLVVPDYHRRGASMDDAAFVEWLTQQTARGHEVVLHGFFHERARRADESAKQKIVTRYYTADEGEFYDLPFEEALRRIQLGREQFAAKGFYSTGFIAPAWLLGADSARAATAAGMKYTTTLGGVRNLQTGEEIQSQSLVYSTRSGWRRAASLLWNASLWRTLRDNPILRIGLHPPDVSHRRVWNQIRRLIARSLRTREPLTYGALLRQSALA
jgi:predicted deacetylase